MTDYKRGKLRSAILQEVEAGALPLIRAHIESYLDTIERYYELLERAKEVSGDPKKARLYLAYSAEARHQEKAAREILVFLGISGNTKLTQPAAPIPPL